MKNTKKVGDIFTDKEGRTWLVVKAWECGDSCGASYVPVKLDYEI